MLSWRLRGLKYQCIASSNLQVADTESDQYGVRSLDDCDQFLLPPQYQPVIFYLYSFANRMIKLTFCQPSLALYNGEAPLAFSPLNGSQV